MSVPSAARRAAAFQLALMLAGLLLVPLALRAVNRLRHAPRLDATYLPAFEGPRERKPFDRGPIDDLVAINPGYVVIGDSMAGTRIEAPLLAKLTGQSIAPVLQAGTGSAFWYLALKNWVIASGVHPRCTFIFFRDTNLTDALFRAEGTFRWSLDLVASDREDEVNAVLGRRVAGPLYRVRSTVDRAYDTAAARDWLEPAVNNGPAWAMFAYRRPRQIFMEHLNERFGLSHLRPMEAADFQAIEDREADFDRFIDQSFLPLMLRDARRAGLPICFVRVQRRPEGGRPPFQSPALQAYIRKLKAYIEANGGMFHDDTGDPQQTIDLYEDGDHLSYDGRFRYTAIFYNHLRPLFP